MPGHHLSMGIALAGLFAATPALTQSAMSPATEAPCPPNPMLPAEWSAWAAPQAKTAAGTKAGLANAELTIGTAVVASLLQTNTVTYVVTPEKPGGSVSYGGMFRFTVAQAGTYRIGLSSGAWIDVLAGNKPAESVGHGHGPACSGVRKMVDFALKPGHYVLQLAANGSAAITVMIVGAPAP